MMMFSHQIISLKSGPWSQNRLKHVDKGARLLFAGTADEPTQGRHKKTGRETKQDEGIQRKKDLPVIKDQNEQSYAQVLGQGHKSNKKGQRQTDKGEGAKKRKQKGSLSLLSNAPKCKEKCGRLNISSYHLKTATYFSDNRLRKERENKGEYNTCT